jgi:hypothetical protein
MRFSFPHSHAFPGGRVLIEEDANEGPCAVEFGDGVSIIGEWPRTADDIYLEVPVYRTAKGTEVAARSWRLKQGEDGAWRSQREG